MHSTRPTAPSIVSAARRWKRACQAAPMAQAAPINHSSAKLAVAGTRARSPQLSGTISAEASPARPAISTRHSSCGCRRRVLDCRARRRDRSVANASRPSNTRLPSSPSRPGALRRARRLKAPAKRRYSSAPPAVAIRLITSGRLKPCQTARLYSGSAPPTTGNAAVASSGPIVQAGSVPTSTQASTSSSTGTRIQCTGSCGGRGQSGGAPKNTSWPKRSEYTTANTPASVASAGRPISTAGLALTNTVSAKNISLLRKPLSSGTPAIAAQATIASVPVIGMLRYRPLSRRMSRVPVSWSMMPTDMKRDALKVAWFIMWKTAATAASGLFSPSSSVISPRWLMVE